MGRKAEAKNRIREALHNGRLSWTQLQKMTKLGKGPLSKNLRLMLDDGEVRYEIDENLRPARGYYKLAKSGQTLADLQALFNRSTMSSNLPRDFWDKMSEQMFMDRFQRLVDEIVEGFIPEVRKNFKNYFQENWFNPYAEFFVKVWVENSLRSTRDIGQILALVIVSRALYGKIPFSIQENTEEAIGEYKKYSEELIKRIESSSKVFDEYSELISVTAIRLIENLDQLIFVEEILSKKEEKTELVGKLLNKEHRFLKERLNPKLVMDLPLKKALDLLERSVTCKSFLGSS